MLFDLLTATGLPCLVGISMCIFETLLLPVGVTDRPYFAATLKTSVPV